jgi:hypothetical protein
MSYAHEMTSQTICAKKKKKIKRETSQITWNGFLCWQTLSLLMNFDTSCRSC